MLVWLLSPYIFCSLILNFWKNISKISDRMNYEQIYKMVMVYKFVSFFFSFEIMKIFHFLLISEAIHQECFKKWGKVGNCENTFQKLKKPSDKSLKKDSVVVKGSNYMKKGEVENWKSWQLFEWMVYHVFLCLEHFDFY